MARAGHLTMWDVGFWIVVAGRQENTQRRRQWLSYKNTAAYLFTTTGTQTPKTYIQNNQGLEPQNHRHIHQGNPNPKQRNINKTKAIKTDKVQLCRPGFV